MLAPGLEQLQGFIRSLGMHFDRAIRVILREAGEPKFVSLPLRLCTKKDALDLACDMETTS